MCDCSAAMVKSPPPRVPRPRPSTASEPTVPASTDRVVYSYIYTNFSPCSWSIVAFLVFTCVGYYDLARTVVNGLFILAVWRSTCVGHDDMTRTYVFSLFVFAVLRFTCVRYYHLARTFVHVYYSHLQSYVLHALDIMT